MYTKKIIAFMVCFAFIFIASCSNIEQPDDSAIEKAFESAIEAKIIWCEIDNMPHDSDIYQEIEGIRYYKVTHSSIKTMAELKDYLETLFSDSIVNGLLNNNNRYMDIDGELYVAAAAGATNPAKGEETYEIIRENKNKIIYRVTVEDINLDDGSVLGHTVTDMIYEYKTNGDKWIFSTFDRVR